MIARVLNRATSLFLCFCAATLLAELIILGYLWSSWELGRGKIIQMLAIAQGVDLAAEAEPLSDLDDVPPEEPSYRELIGARATMLRDLELRELALDNALARLSTERTQLAEDRKRVQQLHDDVQTQLAAWQQGAEAAGRETVGRILESIKPKQAKDLLLEMLDNDEINDVVVILSAMTESKRAKIITEFKTPDETKRIGDVLRLIREGEPASSATSEKLGQLSDDNLTGT